MAVRPVGQVRARYRAAVEALGEHMLEMTLDQDHDAVPGLTAHRGDHVWKALEHVCEASRQWRFLQAWRRGPSIPTARRGKRSMTPESSHLEDQLSSIYSDNSLRVRERSTRPRSHGMSEAFVNSLRRDRGKGGGRTDPSSAPRAATPARRRGVAGRTARDRGSRANWNRGAPRSRTAGSSWG